MEASMWPPPGGVVGPEHGVSVVRHFGDPAAEARAARDSAVVVPMMFLRTAAARGNDVREYLHRRLSQHTKSMAEGDGHRAFLLEATGKVLADTEVFCRAADDLLIVAPSYRAEALVGELGKYVFSEQASFEPTDDQCVVIGVIGPKAAAVLEAADLPVPRDARAFVGVGPAGADQIAVVRSDFALGDYLVLTPPGRATAVWQSLLADAAAMDVRAAGYSAWQTLRVLRVVPLYGVDFDENNTPLDAGLRHGLDRDKGCYPGQEALARTMNLGHPARVVVQVRVDSGRKVLQASASVTTRTGTGAGALTSVIPPEADGPPFALASVAWACRELGTRLIVDSTVGDAEVTVVGVAED